MLWKKFIHHENTKFWKPEILFILFFSRFRPYVLSWLIFTFPVLARPSQVKLISQTVNPSQSLQGKPDIISSDPQDRKEQDEYAHTHCD